MRIKSINIRSIYDQKKMKSGYFLSDGVLCEEKIQSMPHEALIDAVEYCSNIGGINKRIYVDKEFGIPLATMSDMVTNDPEKSCKYVSKNIGVSTLKHTFKDQMILASVVGAIGEVAIVNKTAEGFITGNNIIKLLSNRPSYNGYLYAFLSSKYGNPIIKKLSGGAVQSYVDPELFKKIPIPIIEAEKRVIIHNLIEQSSTLRWEASNILKEATKLIEDSTKITLPKKQNVRNFPIKSLINNYNKRMDSSAYINRGRDYIELLNNKKQITESISSLLFEVSRPGIFKRIKVDSVNGLAYIKGSELAKQNPFLACEYLSKTKTPFLEELRLKEDQILFTCAGSVGNIKLISKEYEEKSAIGSQDIIRISQGASEVSIYYLYCYLKTNIINEYIQSLKYGAVIERVEPFHIESIPVYIPDTIIYEKIVRDIKEYKEKLYSAFKSEEEAISILEKEIESWQK